MKTKMSAKWPLISAVVPCYNAMKFLPESMASLAAMDYPNLDVLVIDDASTDGSGAFIKEHYPQFTLERHQKNQGFSTTVDEGIWLTKGKYVFLVNADTIHSPDYLKIVVAKMEENPDLAAITGKVRKYDFDQHRPLQTIDSVGLIILKNRRVLDLGQGEEDQGQFDEAGPVFGISGQNPLYRRQALEEVAVPVAGRAQREIFDRDFFMYKEEVDLAWRLRLFGWQAWYEPRALAWHGRATSVVRRSNNMEILAHRGKMNNFQKYHSLKNRYLMMIKNEIPGLYFRHLPIIFFYDILYLGYNLVFNFRILGAYFLTIKQLSLMWKKRRWIMKNRTAQKKDLLPWFKNV